MSGRVFFMLAVLIGAALLGTVGCNPPNAEEEKAKTAPKQPTAEEQLNSSDPEQVREGIRRSQEQYGEQK